VGAAAGEDLALVTGRGQADLAAIERRRPYYRDVDVVVMGIRAQDEYRLDLQAAGIVTRPVPTLRAEGAARSAQWARDQLVDCAGYWVHVDMDVLDPAVMPAVDAPSPGGIAFPELELLLAGLVGSPHCLGVEITVFDPDYDPDGGYAEEITSAVVAGLAPVRTVAARPDLVAARDEFEPDPVRARRAAAAAASVPLAAAAMSGGGSVPGTPGEAAAPAVTMHAVEEAEAVEAFPDEFDPAGDARAGDTAAGKDDTRRGPAEDGPDEAFQDAAGAEPEPVEPTDHRSDAEFEPFPAEAGQEPEPVREEPQLVPRPFGAAPLLDSEPMPATRPGMLRPRPAPAPDRDERFSLPVQRPAFDVGSDEPADIS
jgi:arginase